MKKQHYVPRCYLKNFSNKDQLYVFDKSLQKKWCSHIEDISSEKYFYDYNIKEIMERHPEIFDKQQLDYIDGINEQEVEKYFSQKVEGRYSKYLKNIIATFTLSKLDRLINNEIINEHIKYDLSILIAFQFVRTREFRESMIQSQEIITKKLFDTWAGIKGCEEIANKVDFEFSREFEGIEHAKFIMDYNIIEEFGESLFNHIWVFAYNNTDLPLYTSDNPLVKRANIDKPYMSFNGIASKGIELALPINSKIILLMYEKEHFHMFSKFERKLYGFLNKENITYYNSMQVNDAYRQIYSQSDDFILAVKMYDENPKLKDINYKRLTTN